MLPVLFINKPSFCVHLSLAGNTPDRSCCRAGNFASSTKKTKQWTTRTQPAALPKKQATNQRTTNRTLPKKAYPLQALFSSATLGPISGTKTFSKS